jgi:putative flippase GtrA
MIKLLEDYIIEDNHTSWFNKCREVLSYLFFGFLTTLVNMFIFFLLRHFNIHLYLSNLIAWIGSVLFAFITNKLYVFGSKSKDKKKSAKELILFFICRIISLGADMGAMYLLIQVINSSEIFGKIMTNILVIILNYLFSKLFVFKK